MVEKKTKPKKTPAEALEHTIQQCLKAGLPVSERRRLARLLLTGRR